MQGSRRYKPQAAVEISTSDEASQLTLYLQKQLEDDIARIFDESIYPDLELVCGKLKILTHACILKTRSNKFYQQFESFLQVNVDKNTFDEIYSFISDSYTECDIERQEREILSYLEKTFISPYSSNKTSEETELFLTPKCLSPFNKDKNEQKSLSSSPSIELTKEYYALVPIEGNILEKELIEQDVLSNAFQTIINNEKEYSRAFNKPTTLPLGTPASKTLKHSNSCDESLTNLLSDVNTKNRNGNDINSRVYDVPDLLKKASGVLSHRILESNLSPDSLVADDPSSSSDYLSAANASPGSVIPHSDFQTNVCTTKMEHAFTSSDSGLENTGLHESLSSNRDTTSIDVISLTENTLHESNASSLSQYTENDLSNALLKNIERSNDTFSDLRSDSTSEHHQQARLQEISSKEEKQKHNEEIVTLESSSLSSETGSWESVFPPRQAGTDSQKILTNSNQRAKVSEILENKEATDFSNSIATSLVQKSPFKSTSCFIDAASLVDEEEEIRIQSDTNGIMYDKPDTLQLNPSQPVPCSTIKHVLSPQEKSECNDNDDSLEQTDNKDPESIQKDLSPTIFDMTPITEDSLCSNAFEATANDERNKNEVEKKSLTHKPTTVLPYTPYNSIMSVNSSAKQYESESETDTIRATESDDSSILSIQKNRKKTDSQPIVSGGASIEDHLPQVGSYSCSPAMRRKLESTPIVSGAYVSEVENHNKRKSPKYTPMPAWVVDMSTPKSHDSDMDSKRPKDKTCESLKNASKYGSNENCSKSRSSVDSDSSERSSHKFYIDLSTLPDPETTNKKLDSSLNTEKKNIFSMYIDLGESPRLKEMPARLSSSLNCKKQTTNDNKGSAKASKKDKSEPVNNNEHESDPPNDTFETLEMLCSDPSLSLNEIFSVQMTKSQESSDTTKSISVIGMEKTASNLSQIKEHVVTEDIISKESGDLFVRLSDLDKPAPKSDLFVATKGSTRMTRSIPDDNWNNQQRATSRSIDVISSFHSENAQSLNRLFPHLKNEFSASLPGSLSSRTRSPMKLAASRSPGEGEGPASDVSEMSSVQSSMCRSVIDSTTEDTSQTSSLISNCQSRLGQDLLRMFLQEIAPDVVVEVSGRRIKAHKCILSSRCQYFAGILSGGWVESSGNVIVLPPFSFNVVHFALCHIYSGVSTIPDSISIVELATIADMLGLEGLKEVIMFTLKAKYCHHFHKPCQVCTAGVLECFPLSSVYGLDDLYRKCLRWITKYFSKVWPTKAFATLPKELLDKCYQQHIVNLNVETVISTVYGCGLTVSALQNSRWSESVARMCRRLLAAAAQFAASQLEAVVRGAGALPAAAPPAARAALHDCLAAAIDRAPPEHACRAYAFLSDVCTRRTLHYSKPDLISNGHPPETLDRDSLLYARAACWRQQCEDALVNSALRVVNTQAYKELPPELKKRLRELGCITYQATSASQSSLQDGKHTVSRNRNTQSLVMDIVRTSFVPYAPKPVKVGSVDLINTSKDEKESKKSKGQPPKIRMTKAQEERAKYNLLKTNQSRERVVPKAAIKARIENAKPKYLEPRVNKELDKKPLQVKKLAPKMISSSESSRNSSPVQARNLRASRLKSPADVKVHMSQDSLATTSRPWTAEPSTDSLSESQTSNKYATYTKAKYTAEASSESVTTLQSRKTSSTSNKVKTKIPVLCNNPQKNSSKQSLNSAQPERSAESSARNNKSFDRRVPASLMSATKSSSAKIVPKVVKDITVSKNKQIKSKQNKKEVDTHTATEIPIMERSGTFLKDEPTFGDKTIDIDQ